MRFLICLFCSLLSLNLYAEQRDVLVIQSYHQGYFWTDQHQIGLSDVLNKNSITYRVVYLDTRRHYSNQYTEQLFQLYKTKFQSEKYRAIVVNDNQALNLVNRLAEYIQDTPVIFSGINGYTPMLHSYLDATGIISRVEIGANLKLIEALQPKLSKLYVVSGHTLTGAGIRTSVEQFKKQNPDKASLIEHLIPADFSQLENKLSSLKPDSAVLYWNFFPQNGDSFVDTDIWKRIDDISSAPVYVLHDGLIGEGAVGGVIQTSYAQGRSTGQLLSDVLQNPQHALPEVRYATPEAMLDYQALKRWGLSTDTANAMINMPEKLSREARIVIISFLIMVAVIFTLLYYIRRLRLSEEKARRNQVLFESVLDQSHQYIAILDSFGRVTSSNIKLHALLFEQGLDIEKPIWFFKGWENSGAVAFRHYFEGKDIPATKRFESEVSCQKSGSLMLDVVISSLPEESGQEPQYLMEANDITQGKLAEQKLIERESSMRAYYEQQPVMMLTLDGNNRIQAINTFSTELLGFQEIELLGHKLTQFYADGESAPVSHIISGNAHSSYGIWQREVRYRRSDNSFLWIRENIRRLDATGQLLVVGEDITEIHKLNEKLEYQARYDLLTETFNRNHFELELEKSIGEVSDNLRTHAMFYLDLDQLKVLNDTAGHEAGDAAIKFAAMVVETVLPYNSVLSRMGGDEFAVLLRDCTQADAIKISRQIITALSEQAFSWDNISINISCSIGIRLIDHTADSPQMVHAQADAACHAAKDEGRNRYHLYHRDDEELRQRQLEMESVNLVHEALANDRLELFAQQILDLSAEQAPNKMYFEILVRIRNSEGEFISPAIFMPASEKYNVAHLIDKSVVTKTLSWLESNLDNYDDLALCSINLSGQSMGNRAFVDFLLESIQHSPVPNQKICIEITETAAMGNMDQAIELFSKIKQLGCLIALDDFGSGLSSFGYLKKLPADIVKIDGLFVQDMDVNETDLIMVRSINDLAKQMGKRTVAEFVENSRIIDHLVELGVDYAQGYVISKPKPLKELVTELLSASTNVSPGE